MASALTGQHVQELERLLLSRFVEFEREFKRAYPSRNLDPYDLGTWTCYISGKKGHKCNVEEWNGVARDWLSGIYPGAKIHAESWYRNDLAVVQTYHKQYWYEGEYELLALLEQENNPNEICGHLRQFFDFTIKDKILLIWTDSEGPSGAKMVDWAEGVVAFCQGRDIPNIGTIHLIIGDKDHAVRILRGQSVKNESIFVTRTIPTTYLGSVAN